MEVALQKDRELLKVMAAFHGTGDWDEQWSQRW